MVGRQVIAAMSLTWVVCRPGSAEACSCIYAPGIETSVPWQGAVDVPLNVVPWVISGAEVELRDEQGKVVPVETRAVPPVGLNCYRGTELVPTEPLLANTTYTIAVPELIEHQREQGDVFLPGSPSITFTTGTKVLAPNEAAAPATSFVALDAEELTNSCVYVPNQACLWTDTQGLLEVRLMNGEQDVQRYVGEALPVMSFELGNPGTVDCVEIRTRDVAGQLSKPAKHCFDDTQLPHLTRTDFPPEVLVDCTSAAAMAAMNGEVATADDTVSAPSAGAGTSTPEPTRAVATPANGAVACSVELPSSRSGAGLWSTVVLVVAGAVFIRRNHRL